MTEGLGRAASGPDTAPRPVERSTSSAAAMITAWNLVSRLTGFVRVVATASALGIAVLGDAYQRSNQVSNVLFELLAGGMLFSVLIPTFVDLFRVGDQRQARDLAGALATRGIAALGVLVVLGLAGGRQLMELLTAGADPTTRDAQVELGAFLLWFILPQLLLYAAGSVASALLQADRRFAATSIAPTCNNVVVTVTMVAFAVVHDPGRGLALTTGEKVLLGGGTLAGTVAMTVVPFLALHGASLGIRPRWRAPDVDLRPLARRGMWGAGHVGLNQVLILATVVLAGWVDGGVIAYQAAFTFFLLPHALLAHPIFTALFPRLSRHGAADDRTRFARDLSLGLRSMLLLVVPAAGLLAVAAPPALSIVRFGQLDERGTRLVAMVLAAYLLGLAGYSAFFLLTRASYALGDARRPTLVNLWVTAAAVGAMVVATAVTEGTGLLVTFGVVHAITVTAGSLWLYGSLHRSIGEPVPVSGTLGRVAVGAAIATGSAFAVAAGIGWSGTGRAVLAVVAATLVGAAAYGGSLAALRAPELALVRDRAAGVLRRRR
ncbi:MAG: putative rane protein putative virulence factor [Acidimicrobiales bacterium]|nr:putative rane protein putative virulence factor [Acidimicrobiales bacterium]